ncbi:choloylglycine hydrolase [Chitinophaga skermanii]|uniref:Choloylglycine hydrolase n=1 Tax=Chitinophaga skermanii TaxID=331697 RepID=A0A327QWS9_9BACT|nr:linear amide C-N hydrolase [Chitinophaga skermanii]RAJ08791.1 choloylglycine hydrolase [Chitinophaga skermanii]
MKTVKYIAALCSGFLLLLIAFPTSKACTRVVYKGLDGLVLTARSMDWKSDIQSNLWIFPRGITRNGEVGANSVKWTSKYGSVIVTGYDISTTDGMNEKGLVANILWLVESEYPVRDESKPGMSIAIWAQYVLDNYATVAEAVAALKNEPFQIVTDNVPGELRTATLHMSLSDKHGDNAIFEYIKGKLVVHHDTAYNVMTNSPIFEKQLALDEYWREIGGTVMLPGTNRAADRFVRASFYAESTPKTADMHVGVASMFSVIRSCSTPLGISTPDQPNISSTRWRIVADHKNLVYFFESTMTPNTFWVNFKNVDFSQGAPIKKLSVANHETYAGDASKNFVASKPFAFLGTNHK